MITDHVRMIRQADTAKTLRLDSRLADLSLLTVRKSLHVFNSIPAVRCSARMECGLMSYRYITVRRAHYMSVQLPA